MDELQEVREIAIGMGTSITEDDDNVGFIACFRGETPAEIYVYIVEDYECLTAARQDRCVVVVTMDSLM